MEIGSDVDRESGGYEKSKMHKAEINNKGTSIREIKGASASCLCDFCANFAVTFSFNDDEIEGLRKVNTHEMLHQRKLHLVLNLDHTLLTRAQFSDLTPEEEECVKTLTMDHALPLQDVFKVQDCSKMKPMIFKLRPFVRAFLKEASDMFEIYAYTNASRPLVWKMVELLDPRNEYFGRRVISREDFVSTFAGKKCLDLVLAQESTVLILDHKQETWMEQNKKNIVLTQKYQFFKERSEQNSEFKSHCELKTDEGVYLAVILQHLKLIHSRFFDDQVMCDNLIDRDVRKVLETLRGYVLKGCKIAFDPLQANKPRLWKMAEQLGANCVEQLDPSVTHVVAAHVGTPESRWAVERNKFLVHPSWIEASNWMWEKSHEDKFPVI
ncbi:RNA polymerase II C-terminal domain phosphatase-like 4 [Rosa sericea]